ncbi:MAG: WXG100 family type VII secretion target [Chloroflexi bacterium AL-W]|nr:WXG100 family type VII secretion target [Chloroflexi bacterium AL-N1]NOK69810.1 WXG100 family type VII secretion target [Chloroflexi bacterium AL-N10]NOK73586.1 WXG100 family type VII secretion target [Chloroflexi bacterium AL-N5]NOK83980.1 WXG100 family type VII secretion target [Chloroflexi bacterium AL-W]NOK87917.1 WXG100 family type VII secretion target [Chloroflexi bacterium AL-N15]
MSDRVLSSGAARDAISKMQTLINSDLIAQINALNAQGQILSDPNVWDGSLAGQFRGDWPSVKARLDTVAQTLEELRSKVQMINQNIMSAGGNQ